MSANRCAASGSDHIGGRAKGDAKRSERRVNSGGIHRLGNAEVRHKCVAAAHHHVVGVDIAMQHALLVRIREGIGDLAQESHGLGDR